ncbi:MAG: NmrA family NAD(P)-binding protein [Tildeniella nuda ZEHNDER 1965/U140]|jgi:hypothetical protein|nr:NmrA family NAD(P)-binding protein [Tildeniella nuda ZEHNDER 1965/U140]
MTTKTTVLVVGSTGMLGSKIVAALLDKGNIDIRGMVRSINDSNAENRKKIEAMKARGVAIVEGDLMQPETLLSVTTLEVAGEVLTAKQLKAAYEAATGNQLTEKPLGSVAALQAWIAVKKTSASSPFEYIPQQYEYAMVSGKGKLDQLQNDRYPHIKPLSVKQFLSKGES